MKILFIVQNIIGQGTYLRAFELAKALAQMGHEMTILASAREVRTPPSITMSEGIEIIEVSDFISGPTQSGWDVYNLLQRIHLLKGKSFDLVHAFETRPTVIHSALSLKRRGIPLFFDWADWFGKGGSVEQRPNPLLRTLLKPIETYYENHFRGQALGTTVICSTLKQRAIELGVDQNQLCVLPNGFDIPGWENIPIQQAQQNCHLDDRHHYIGYLGSLFPSDSLLLANGFNHLLKLMPNVRLLHIGKSNYQAHQHIQSPDALIETGAVTFTEMMTYLSASDVLWLPFVNSNANRGRFPFKFSNYLASGRPIIATDVGDIPGFIREYQTGLVTDDKPDALALATQELLQDPLRREIYAKNASDLSQNDQFSWANRANQLVAFYKERLASND